jgi:hypothetical protein
MKPGPAMPILLTVLAGATGGLSCADIAAPGRSDVYEWRFIASTGPGTSDTLSFHWPRSRLPVRIWTEDALGLPSHIANSIERWKAAFLYQEFDAIQVPDSNSADIIVRAETPAKVAASARLEGRSAPECDGATDIVPPLGVLEIQYPVRVFLNPRFDPESPGVAECLALTATHELGHALGIFAHSPDEGDIMFANPVVSTLTARDRATAERAYHVEPNLTVPVR